MNKKLLFLGILLICKTVFADDTTGTTAAGGIQFTKTPFIQMQRETLTITPTQVSVAFLFKNISNKTITTMVYFPLPPYENRGGGIVTWDKEVATNAGYNESVQKEAPFNNFSVIVNNQPVAYQIKQAAFLNGKDITDTLIKAGLPLNTDLVGYGYTEEGAEDLNPARFQRWQNTAKKLSLLDKKGYPLWRKQVFYYWMQTFPAGKTVAITHTYKPATGSMFSTTPVLTETIQAINEQFNINLADFNNQKAFQSWYAHQKLNLKNSTYGFFYNVQYILKTGVNWAGPIKEFTLNLQYPTDGVVTYNNFYGDTIAKINQTAGKTQISLNDFTPRQDLNIVFGSQ